MKAFLSLTVAMVAISTLCLLQVILGSIILFNIGTEYQKKVPITHLITTKFSSLSQFTHRMPAPPKTTRSRPTL